MNNNLNKKHGFSLAEALITLLIVCLITLASVPVLTKKHRNKMLSVNKENTNQHGKYSCILKNGVHHYHSEINGETKDGMSEAGYCEFEPPKDARDFTIMVIGGGGGGGGSYVDEDLKTFNSSDSYKIPEDGKYEFMLIGGGGGGDASGYSKNSFGGCSGGILIDSHDFKKDEKLEFHIGKGGLPAVAKPNIPAEKKEFVIGTDGGDTFLNFGTTKYIATGGQSLLYGDYCKPGIPNGVIDIDAWSCPKFGFNRAYRDGDWINQAELFLPSNLYPTPGCGGYGNFKPWTTLRTLCSASYKYKQDLNTCTMAWNTLEALRGHGSDGYFSIRLFKKYCGEGGSAAVVNTHAQYKLDKKIHIKVGKGGKGSTDSSLFGEDGQYSKFGNFFVSQGGSGGKNTTSCPIMKDVNVNQDKDGKIGVDIWEFASGQNGQASAFVNDINAFGACGGGHICTMADEKGKSFESKAKENGLKALSYGSGGGGGAYEGKNTYGIGGNGADGMVYVEW